MTITAAEFDRQFAEVPLPPEPPPEPGPSANGHTATSTTGQADDTEPTTWTPTDLAPYLRGEVERTEPTIGLARADGLRLIYPGREHAVVGETESGKSWFALACVAAELTAGNHVVYVHYEEGDPGSTIERLQLIDVTAETIASRLRFVAPDGPVRPEYLPPLLDPAPTLVIHDGLNEAMALHGGEIKEVEAVSAFRRRLVAPFIRVGAAVVSCDHVPMIRDGARRDAYGSVHKGNALDGARIALENAEPFGRHMRGVSHVYVTKDRPGHLRAHGKPTKVPGKTYLGTLVADDSQTTSPDFDVRLLAPSADDTVPKDDDPAAELKTAIYQTVAGMPGGEVASKRKLLAALRNAGHAFKNTAAVDAVDDLVDAGSLVEVPGKRSGVGYRTVQSASPASSDSSAPAPGPAPLPASASPIRGEAGKQSAGGSAALLREAVGSSGKQSNEDSNPNTIRS